mgnify:CR=1 FL=1
MQNRLDLGNWNAICDSCGRKFKASQLLRRWDGLMVCKEDYEVRHPQNFLRVQKERISVPWVRPQPEVDTFVNYCNIFNSQGIAGIGLSGCMVSGKIATGQLT